MSFFSLKINAHCLSISVWLQLHKTSVGVSKQISTKPKPMRSQCPVATNVNNQRNSTHMTNTKHGKMRVTKFRLSLALHSSQYAGWVCMDVVWYGWPASSPYKTMRLANKYHRSRSLVVLVFSGFVRYVQFFANQPWSLDVLQGYKSLEVPIFRVVFKCHLNVSKNLNVSRMVSAIWNVKTSLARQKRKKKPSLALSQYHSPHTNLRCFLLPAPLAF